MMIPTIHANGTSKERLLEALLMASQALDLAYQSIKQTAPNGRDYYPQQGNDALQQAQQEHMNRLRKVDEVKAELDAIIVAIDGN